VDENDRAITGLVMVAHGMVHTYELSLPILVTIWLSAFERLDLVVVAFDVTAAVLGGVLAVGYGLFGLGALPGGVLADAYGSRTLILLCLVGMGGSFLLLSLAPTLLVVALALVCWGVAASVYHPSGLALISKGVSRRGTAFAYHGMAGNLGIALGPLLTALLLLVFEWRAVVAFLAVPALVAAVFAARVEVDETAAVASDGGADTGGDARADGSVSSLPEFLADSRRLFAGAFVAVFAVVMLSGLYYRGVLTFLPEILDGYEVFAPVGVAGREVRPSRYVYVGILMCGILGQYTAGKLTDRIPVELGLVGGFGALAVLAVLFLPVANAGLVPFLVLGAVLGVALFVVQPFYQATVAEYTPAGTRGLSYGYTYLGVFGVGALGASVAGTALTYFSLPILFGVLAAFGALASLLGAGLFLSRERRSG
jgi:MFS family permease